MTLRKVIFWLHLTAGALAGVVIFVMSVTGALLAFEKQMTTQADSNQSITPPTWKILPMEHLLAKVRAANSNAMPSMITMRSAPTAPVAFSFGKDKTVFVNPYTGDVLGEGSRKARSFFSFATDLHRWLATSTENRAIGKAITGAANLVFLFLVISGIYLWFPRQWTRASLRAVTRFNGALRGKARTWNWHNVIGFWSCIPLLLIVITGVIMSYTWANNLLFQLTGNEVPPQRQGAAESAKGERKVTSASAFSLNHFDKMWTRAEEKVPGWQTITLRLPPAGNTNFSFVIEQGGRGRPDLRSQLNLNGETGEEVSFETYANYNAGRKLRSWVRWVHTGEAVDVIGQLIAFLAAVGGAFLVWTGFALAINRFRMRNVVTSMQTETVSNVLSSR